MNFLKNIFFKLIQTQTSIMAKKKKRKKKRKKEGKYEREIEKWKEVVEHICQIKDFDECLCNFLAQLSKYLQI